MAQNETNTEKFMRILGITEEEAQELIKYDKAVDHNEKTPYDLTPQQEKDIKQYRRAERKPTVYNFSKRERKADAIKGNLIQNLKNALERIDGITNIQVVNAEKLITFSFNDDNFDLDLRKKRKPKEEK